MDLLERYLQAVRKYLPWTIPAARQADIVAELRANYESQLEEREADLGRKLTEGEMTDWLKQLGAPIQVAGRYQPVQYLIGPTLFPMYLYVLRLAAGMAALIYAVVCAALFLSHSAGAGSIVEDILRAPGVLFTVAAWVTLVFVVIEYVSARHPDLLPRMEGINAEWSPASLPTLEKPRRDCHRARHFAEAVAHVVFSWLFTIWLLLVPVYPWLILGPAAAILHDVNYQLTPFWWTFFWVVAASNIAQAIWYTLDLVHGTWRNDSPLRRAAKHALGLIAVGTALLAPNHAYLQPKTGGYAALSDGITIDMVNMWFFRTAAIIFAIVAVQLVWELIQWLLQRGSKVTAN